MQEYTLNDDITLKVVSHLDLSTILSLSRTCQRIYQLSLSSLSFWINAADAHQFPVPISAIRDHYEPEEVRYMARVISCYQYKIRGGGRTERSNRGVGLSSATRVKFRQEGLVRLSSKGQEGLLGVSSAMVQGYTADSLPWLISVKGKTIRCDSIDEEYITGVEWEADGLVDWFWRYDILTERDREGSGRLREYVTVTFLTNGSYTNLLQSTAGPPGSYQESLHTIKIYLPSKTELVPVPKTPSYLGALGTLISSNTPPVLQNPLVPAPRVVHHDSVKIPRGFNCGLCRPATDGSLVYLLARTKQRFIMALGAYAFWVFVYDWKTGRGLQIRLPEEGSWRKVAGSGHTVILQDWRDMMYTVDLSSEFAVPLPSHLTPEDEDPSSPWRSVKEGPRTALVHMPFRHQEEANLMPITGNIFQTTGESFCLISRLGERLYCHLFRRSSLSSSKLHSTTPSTPDPGFTHIGTGYIDIDGGEEQLGISFLHKTRGTRSLLGYSADDGTKRTVHFFVVDFEIDCGQDGTEGLQSIRGRKQELLVRGEAQGQSSGPSHHNRLASTGPRIRGLDQILGRNNMQEVFYDGFRGTVGMVNKEYTEIVLFRTTRD
ncbi:hypothetical protein BDM02DRAFT_3191403 [Thelephora ganbajun]|uniref:Uncharacterized protein n=1 Tax=Thelephora ganbajun TaxID=370292 RepID=A0ACB6Z3A2_THEGA|nr:hypothetical protein BDM02DRAFT_3191403 [Thelephora ganbajun]